MARSGSASASAAPTIGQKRKRASDDPEKDDLLRDLPPEMLAEFDGRPSIVWASRVRTFLKDWYPLTDAKRRVFTEVEWRAIDTFLPRLLGYPSERGAALTLGNLEYMFLLMDFFHQHSRRVGESLATPEALASALHYSCEAQLYATDAWAYHPALTILAPESAWHARWTIVATEPEEVHLRYDPLFKWIYHMQMQNHISHMLTLSRCWKHMGLLGCLADQRWSSRQRTGSETVKKIIKLFTPFVDRVVLAIQPIGIVHLGIDTWNIIIDMLTLL